MKRIILLLVFFVSVFLTPQIYAAQTETPWLFGGDFDASVQEGVGGGNNAESWVVGNFANFMPNALNMALIGVSSNTIEKIARGEPIDPKFYSQIQQRSVLGGTSRAIAKIYESPPASLAYWINDVGQTLGFIVKPTYAQGIGFSGLSALLPVWKAFRNIAYLILAVVMIVIGFMVMLRKKIDPKTVVTVQNALPRIVITLILITFSYAIVGFLIDLMYLLILLVVAVVGPNIQGANLSELQAAFTAGGAGEIGKIWWSLKPITPAGGWGIVAGIIGFILPGIGGIITAVIVALATGLAVSGGSLVGLLSPILLLLLSLSLIVTFIRILFLLIGAYINIVISIIFGPLQLMLDAVPGGNGFASWLNNLVVNLLTFPIVISLILLGASIGSGIDATQGTFWSPPLVPKAPDTSTFIQALIGAGIVMSIPSILHAVKEALKVKPMVPTGAGVLTQPIGSAVGGALSFGTQFYYIGSIPMMIDNWRKGKATIKATANKGE